MFRGQPNVFDDLITKATDENNTSEDWEAILTICDKVKDGGEQSARNAIAALLKRLAHRSPNVQLYALSVADALSKNCGVTLHSELASRAFTQGLERLVTDRTTHDKVRKRALSLVQTWTLTFKNNPSLGVMEECYKNFSRNHQFDVPDEPPPPAVDEVRRREEEELQRALEISLRDYDQRNGYTPSQSSSHHSGGGSRSGPGGAGSNPGSGSTYLKGYGPARSPPAAASSTSSIPAQTAAAAPAPASTPVVTRVRAMHTFEATEPGELAFERGDIIRVVDRAYRDWWRGHLRGRTGIFPVNYVESLPEPTVAELAREAEQEAAVFAQAANVDRLLTLLRGLDSSGERLADNEEIQELYRSCMALRPKIVKLIDKYSQKRADLVSMNEAFVKARTLFDRMMEENLARHVGGDLTRGAYSGLSPVQQEHDPQLYGPGYSVYEQPPAQYVAGQPGQYPVGGYPNPAQSPYPAMQPQAQAPYLLAQTPYPQGQAVSQPLPAHAQDTIHSPQPQHLPHMHPPTQTQQGAAYAYGPNVARSEPPVGPQSQTQAGQSPSQQSLPYAYDPNGARSQPPVRQPPQTQAQHSPQPVAYVYDPNGAHSQPPVGQQPQALARHSSQSQQGTTYAYDLSAVHSQPSEQQQPPTQAQLSPQTQQGPPYLYDPKTMYADQNVQAWAQYYAQGGTDPAGAVYFFSVPGVTSGSEEPATAQEQGQTGEVQEQAGGQGQVSVTKASPTLSQQPGQHALGPVTTDATSPPQNADQGWQPQHQSYGHVPPHSYSPQQHVPISSAGGYAL